MSHKKQKDEELPALKVDIPQDLKPGDPEVKSEGILAKLANFPIRRELIFSVLAHALGGAIIEGKENYDQERDEAETVTEEKVSRKDSLKEFNDELARKIDIYIDKYLDPNADSYVLHEIPGEEVYFDIDATNRILFELQRLRDDDFDIDKFKEKQEAEKKKLKEEYDEKLKTILDNPELKFTGEPDNDFQTLQEAMFYDENNFFKNEYFTQTMYKLDSANFDTQMRIGVVNCQVARATTILLNDIYKAKGISRQNLANFRVVIWEDHISSAYLLPDGSTWQMQELGLRKPFVEGLKSAKSGQQGKLMPVRESLAYYLIMNGATKEQKTRIESLGFSQESGALFSEKEQGTELMSLFEFENGQGNSAEKSEKLDSNQIHTEMRYFLGMEIERMHSGALYTPPSWLGNEELEDFILNYDNYPVNIDKYLTILEVGAELGSTTKFIKKALDIYRQEKVLDLLFAAGSKYTQILDVASQDPEFMETWDKIPESISKDDRRKAFVYLKSSMYLNKENKLKRNLPEVAGELDHFFKNKYLIGGSEYEMEWTLRYERYKNMGDKENDIKTVKTEMAEIVRNRDVGVATFTTELYIEIEKKLRNEKEDFYDLVVLYVIATEDYSGNGTQTADFDTIFPAIQRHLEYHPEEKQRYSELFASEKMHWGRFVRYAPYYEFLQDSIRIKASKTKDVTDMDLLYFGFYEIVKGEKFKGDFESTDALRETFKKTANDQKHSTEFVKWLREKYLRGDKNVREAVLEYSAIQETKIVDDKDLFPEDLITIELAPSDQASNTLKSFYTSGGHLSNIIHKDFEKGFKSLKERSGYN